MPTGTVTVDELLPVLLSGWSAVTTAVLLSVMASFGMTVTVTVAEPLKFIVPRLQVSVLPTGGEQLHWVGVAETNVALAGKLSTSVTLVAVLGHRFVTTISKVRF